MRYIHISTRPDSQLGITYNIGSNKRKRKERKARALAKAIRKLIR